MKESTREVIVQLKESVVELGKLCLKYRDVMDKEDVERVLDALTLATLTSYSLFLQRLGDRCEEDNFEAYLKSEERINAFKEADIQAIRDGVEIAEPWHERIKQVYESDRVNFEGKKGGVNGDYCSASTQYPPSECPGSSCTE